MISDPFVIVTCDHCPERAPVRVQIGVPANQVRAFCRAVLGEWFFAPKGGEQCPACKLRDLPANAAQPPPP